MRRTVLLVLLAVILMAVLAMPVLAQVFEPDGLFQVSQVEVYRNCIELGDQLYLATYTVDYSSSPAYPINLTFLGRLMNGGAELGSVNPYPYFDSGYDLGIFSIYFPASSAPAWSGAYTMYLSGNPAIHWLDSTAMTAMHSAQAYDAPAYTDETAASNSAAANDMTLLPAIPVVGDAYYFGSTSMFNILTVNIGTAGSWTGTLAWEYWNGSVWTAVSGLTDGTNAFQAAAGNHDVVYTCPTDWQPSTVNGVYAYYLRSRVATYTGIVTQPLGTQSWTNSLSVPPSVSNAAFSLWYDGGTVAATRSRLTTRLRTLASVIEVDWGGTGANNLIEDTPSGKKLTSYGEIYFTNTISNLRLMAPELFSAYSSTPDFSDKDVVRNFYAEGDDTQQQAYGVNWYAQTFRTTQAYSIGGVEIKAFRTGTPGTVTVSVRATAAGLPSGADLASGTISGDTFTTGTSGAWYWVSFADDTDLSSATTYSIVVRAIGGVLANRANWRVDSAGTYTGGQAASSNDSGATWVAAAAQDFMFVVRAVNAHSLSYRDQLAGRLVGTSYDMTTLGSRLGMSRMWISSFVWYILSVVIAVFAARRVNSTKLILPLVAIMSPFGALAGFVYLEVSILFAFLLAVGAIYVVFFNKAS